MSNRWFLIISVTSLVATESNRQSIHDILDLPLLENITDSVNLITGLNDLKVNKPLYSIVRGRNLDCPLPLLQNGYVLPLQDKYKPGDSVKILCEEDYLLEEGFSTALTCDSKGVWVALTENKQLTHYVPRCIKKLPEVRDCVLPNPPSWGKVREHVVIDKTGAFEKMIIQAVYECSSGFKLDPLESKIRTCNNGVWTGIQPKCVRGEGCRRPMIPPRTHFSTPISSFKPSPMSMFVPVGFSIRFYCDIGYELVDYPKMFCMAGGEWHPRKPPRCLPASKNRTSGWCPSIGELNNTQTDTLQGVLTSRGARDGTLLKISCVEGYNSPNLRPACSSSIVLCNDGHWEGQWPQCEPVKGCLQPGGLNNGHVQVELSRGNRSNFVPVYSNATYKCSPGYVLEGTSSAVCQPNGCWHPMGSPKCVGSSFFVRSNQDAGLFHGSTSLMATVATACTVLFTLSFVWMLIACRARAKRQARLGQLPTPQCSAPAASGALESPRNFPWNLVHWPRSNSPGQGSGIPEDVTGGPMIPPPNHEDVDRVALIACIDGVQVVLPTYEEATCAWPLAPPPYDSIVNECENRPLDTSDTNSSTAQINHESPFPAEQTNLDVATLSSAL